MTDIAFYRDRTDGSHPIYDSEARRRDPNTLFGSPLSPEDWDRLNIDPVFAVERPAYDPSTHKIAEGPGLPPEKWSFLK